MSKQTKQLHGSCSEAYINGQRDALATKIEVKVTGDFEDQNFCGEYGTYPIYNGYSIEGTITDMKCDSQLELAILDRHHGGVPHRHHAGHRADDLPAQSRDQAVRAVEHRRRGVYGGGAGQHRGEEGRGAGAAL